MFATRESDRDTEKRLIFKRRYRLYYALNFLQGFRKQMFITFAIFALVKVHEMPVKTTMILILVNQILVTLTGPLMGGLVDRCGERAMLSASYIGLVFVFLGYAIVEHRQTLYVLYCIDNLIFFGGIALTTYLHRIAPEADLVNGGDHESRRGRYRAADRRTGMVLFRLQGHLLQRVVPGLRLLNCLSMGAFGREPKGRE